MFNSVTKKTGKGYAKGAGLWREFLSVEHTSGTHPGEFLQNEVSDEGRALQVILFVTWLLDAEKVGSGEVWTMVTHLRHHLSVQGGKDCAYMDKGLVSKARRSGIRSVAEAKDHLRAQEDRQFMPAAPEMLRLIHRTHWEETDWSSTAGRDKKMVALAGWLMTDSGLRISNVAAAEPNAEDHALRGREVVAIAGRGLRGTKTYEGATAIKALLAEDGVVPGDTRQFSRVVHLQVKILTTKTMRLVKKKAPKINILDFRRETADESAFIDAMLAWIQRSECMDDEQLFFRRKHAQLSTVLRLTSRMVAEAMKGAAEHFNLNPARFSTCSFRKHYVSMAPSTGTSAEERNLRGGWATGSTVPDTSYDTRETVGLLGRRGGAEARVSVPSVEMLHRRGAGKKSSSGKGNSSSETA
ncbi:hypothetical protein B484DRAFT_459855 [Ochromonadaceae sp. CCMP2298]|nr:hypothetical protein B484DRAFT_459855 [Ochromonadaceae sp. CCMP2298]